MNNNLSSLRAEMNSNSDTTRAELLERIDQRSRLSSRSSRVSSRTTSSKQLALRHAVTLTATIPVVTAPIIVTVLKTPPYLAIPDIGCSTTHMEPILSATNITVLESPQQPLETMIEVPVHTSTSPHDITPPFKSNLASEAIPMDDNYNDKASVTFCVVTNQFSDSTHQLEQPCFTFNSDNSNRTSTQVPSDKSSRIDVDVYYESEQDDPINFNNQSTNSTLQLEHPYPIIIEDNFSNNKYGCFSGDCNGYSDWGTVHAPMTMVLVS